MGASVYAVIEYREHDFYWSFGQINLPRDVEFLCAIAWGDGGVTENMPYLLRCEVNEIIRTRFAVHRTHNRERSRKV